MPVFLERNVLKQKVEIHVGRVSGSSQYINLTLTDPISGVQFADLEIPFEKWGSLIGSGPMEKVDAELRGLQYVGKKRITEPRTASCPIDSYDKTVLEQWLKDNCQEDGWIVSTYLGSQGSVQRVSDRKTHKFERTVLRYNVTKYVDPD